MVKADNFEKNVNYETKKPFIVGDIEIAFISNNRFTIMFVYTNGPDYCIEKAGIMSFIFSDGTKMKLYNCGGYNCRGRFEAYFGGVYGNKSKLLKLSKKKVSSMRVYTINSYVEEDLTSNQSESFSNIVNCILSK